jgi:protein-S-isoprenylcysteine O-methyltransferase Ste14
MSVLLGFRIAQLVVLAAFTMILLQGRGKSGTERLVDGRLLFALEVCCLVPILVYAYVLAALESVLAADWVALAMTTAGTALVAKSKADLGSRHTWSGYRRTTTQLVTNGVYAYVRHPLYAASYVFIAGGLATILHHAPYPVIAVALVPVVYVLGFTAFVARREGETLDEQFGDRYRAYRARVHPFLPLRRFEPWSGDADRWSPGRQESAELPRAADQS